MTKKLFGFNINQQWDYENGFYITSHVTRLSKMAAHYELYKSIVNLPGDIVECGVFKGTSLIRFSTFREIFETTYSRKIIGFDAFGKFPEQKNADDQKFIKKFEGECGYGISVPELKKIFAHKAFCNYEFIQGDVVNTIPEYISKHPELKLALLHIDLDTYRPSLVALEQLYDRVVKGGLVLFDDYGKIAGETKAIDEFFIGKNVLIEKLPISCFPSYIRKK